MHISLKQIDNDKYMVYSGTKHIGDFIRDVDAYFKFWVNSEIKGYWTEEFMMEIVVQLHDLNVPVEALYANMIV
jgi:hypothetical protein